MSVIVNPAFRTVAFLGLVALIAASLVACGDDDSKATDTVVTDTNDDTGDTDVTDSDTADMGDATDVHADGSDMSDIGDADTNPDLVMAPPDSFGPNTVGYIKVSMTYDPIGPDTERTIPMDVWYPAMSSTGAPLAVYRVAGLIEQGRGWVYDSPMPAMGSFPVVVYSHGSGGEGLLAYPYAELFASWGWMVVAPSHIGNTAIDAVAGTESFFAKNAVNRPVDIIKVLDAVENGIGDTVFDNMGDTSRVFVFGHSFGGFTTFAVGGADIDHQDWLDNCTLDGCTYLADPEVAALIDAGFGDPRVDAIAPQAPAFGGGFAAGEIAGITLPTMLQTGRLDQSTTQAEEAEPAWAAMDNPEDVWVEMPQGAHYSFITICDDLEEPLLLALRPNALSDGCGMDFIPTTVAVPVLAEYLLAFARLHVLNETDAAAIITGPVLDSGFVLTFP